uniref:PIR2-like helical domain-containing protein n=1 Tax=Opuntia streptacantha TaxID=393608 RepID=A0A7C8ZBC4_OPUST
MDVLANILHHSLTYLNDGSCENDVDSDASEVIFANLRQLEEDCLADMVRFLQQFRPHLSRGDALWCLLMSDLDVGRASTLEIPMLPSSNVSSNTESDSDSADTNATSCRIRVPPGLPKFPDSWDLQNGADSKLSANGFGRFFSFSESSIQRDIGCPGKLNLSPAMKSLLKRNVAAFAAGFLPVRLKTKLGWTGSA